MDCDSARFTMSNEKWQKRLAKVGHGKMAAELLSHLNNCIAVGVYSDTEVNMKLAQINVLLAGFDLEMYQA